MDASISETATGTGNKVRKRDVSSLSVCFFALQTRISLPPCPTNSDHNLKIAHKIREFLANYNPNKPIHVVKGYGS